MYYLAKHSLYFLGINYLHKMYNLQVIEEYLVHQELKEIREKEDYVD